MRSPATTKPHAVQGSQVARLGAVGGLIIAVILTGGAPAEALRADPVPNVLQAAQTLPLSGKVVVIDPGHQLGNHNFPAQINAPVPAGGFTKACNTTGTATNAGFPEATFNWRVARVLKRRLEHLGARVVLTRRSNRQDRWGPCIDVRGRAGNAIPADAKVSIHGDGSTSGGRGFHVIAPTDRAPWTDDIFAPSRRLARVMKRTLLARGYRPANYIAGGDGLDFRSDLGTLNLSDVPTVMVESGNMRGADARWMSSRQGRRLFARSLARAVRLYLT